MGNFYSRYLKDVFDEAVECESCEYGPAPVDEGCLSCPNPTYGPESTPKPRVLAIDPRSPTEGITRTPIEVSSASKEFRRGNYESREVKFQDEHTPSMVCDPKHKHFLFDPRSPAAGLNFKRTPIQFLDVSADFEESDSCDEVEEVSNVKPSAEEVYHVSNVEEVSNVKPSTEEVYHVSDVEEVSNVKPSAEEVYHVSDDQEPTEKMPDTIPAVTEKDILKHKTTDDEIVSVTEGVPKEVSEADFDCEASSDQDKPEVVTPLQTTAKTNQRSCSTMGDVEKIVHNSSIYLLDTPKSTDKKSQHQIQNDKENSSVVKKRVFRTPEAKAEVGVKPKARTPLGSVGGTNSPLKMLRDKQSSLVKKNLSTRTPQFQQVNRTSVD